MPLGLPRTLRTEDLAGRTRERIRQPLVTQMLRNNQIAEATGHSGGIWILTSERDVDFRVISSNHQAITVTVTKANSSWYFTAIYGSLCPATREFLWTHLIELKQSMTGPWLLLGDFNDILLPSEVSGGAFLTRRAEKFSDTLHKCELMDLGCKGNTFTWRRTMRNNVRIAKCLDRALANVEWRVTFPGASVHNLFSNYSDHNPVGVFLNKPAPNRNKPFRMEAAWTLHPAFPDVVRKAWSRHDKNIANSLASMRKEAIKFNQETFGNIFKRKRNILARLSGIQRTLDTHINGRLLAIERELRKELEEILKQEEILWFQKSRENWVKHGSRNTKFFHAQTLVRRKRNRIEGLFINSDEWCTDEEKLESEVTGFFKNLFQKEINTRTYLQMEGIRPLNSMEAQLMSTEVTREEVWMAIKSMKAYKAPGPDGFQPLFFQKYWDTVGDSVVEMDTLAEFCLASGLKINVLKSKASCSPKVSRSLRSDICRISGINFTEKLGKYLGVPLFQGRVRCRDFNYIIQNLKTRLSSWKANILNKAGRVILAKAVLSAIPVHTMQTVWVPEQVCENIDKNIMSFIWSSKSSGRDLHLVNWDKIAKPRDMGGLGLRKARQANTALLGKASWSIITGEDKLWVRILERKYLNGRNPLNIISKPLDSMVWKGILKASNRIKIDFGFRIGNGDITSIWHDRWVKDKPLYDWVNDDKMHLINHTSRVSSLIQDGRWQTDELTELIPSKVIESIHNIPLPQFPREDKLIWKIDPSGKYNAKNGYKFLIASVDCSPSALPWNKIWKLNCSENIKQFIWLLANNALPTNELRSSRGLSAGSTCRRCNTAPETSLHCLRDCDESLAVWARFGFNNLLNFLTSDTMDWILKFARVDITMQTDGIRFLCVLYGIWKGRNARIFKNKPVSLTSLCKSIEFDVERWGNPRPAGIGGLFRDSNGSWITGFSGAIEVNSNMVEELMAIRCGLSIGRDRGIVNLLVESDSLEAVNLISMGDSSFHSLGNILEDIRQLSSSFGKISFRHIFREANQSADFLAKLGLQGSVKLTLWEDPPSGLALALLADSLSTCFPR
ncbi:ribonuclease H [Senna tora]|uniref:Ribonuclease H n=1 Tax=Senna tora TaxID=362788 RepID=A0A834W8V9_9FABA|nr:ribonuclease H [Senna tora]